MNYFKELKGTAEHTTWNTQINNGDTRIQIMEFLDLLKPVTNSQKIQWIRPSHLKHVIESYCNNIGRYDYICRDQTTAMAIVCGYPVNLQENPENNKIGIYLTKGKWLQLCTNINNNKATDLDLAAHTSYDKYSYSLYKKEMITNE